MRVHVLVGQIERALLAAEASVLRHLFEAGNHILDAVLLGGIMLEDRLLHGLRRGDRSSHLHADEVSQIVESSQVLGISHGHGKHTVTHRDRHDLVDFGHRRRNKVHDLRGDVRFRQIDDRHAPLLGERFRQLLIRNQPELESHLPQNFTGALLLLLKHVPELILGQIAEIHQDLSKTTLSHVNLPLRRPPGLIPRAWS